MLVNQVRNTGDALAYLTDCTLATVCDLASKRKRPKYEFERQMNIAQRGVDWMVQMGVDASSSRAKEVLQAGSVKQWAVKFFPE